MLQGYRTYIVAALMAAFGVMASFDWISVFNDPRAGLVALGSAIIMAVLRSVTTTPPGVPKVEESKEEDK
jgi:hypothetical protein